MARTTGPVCRLCRREGLKLFLKGTRCDTPKCAVERRETPPGMATPPREADRLRHSPAQKQKVKRYYGVLERQFRGYYKRAVKGKGNTGEALMSFLDRGSITLFAGSVSVCREPRLGKSFATVISR